MAINDASIKALIAEINKVTTTANDKTGQIFRSTQTLCYHLTHLVPALQYDPAQRLQLFLQTELNDGALLSIHAISSDHAKELTKHNLRTMALAADGVLTEQACILGDVVTSAVKLSQELQAKGYDKLAKVLAGKIMPVIEEYAGLIRDEVSGQSSATVSEQPETGLTVGALEDLGRVSSLVDIALKDAKPLADLNQQRGRGWLSFR